MSKDYLNSDEYKVLVEVRKLRGAGLTMEEIKSELEAVGFTPGTQKYIEAEATLKKRTLGELKDQLLATLLDIDAAEGVLEDGLEAALDEATGGFGDKVESCVSVAQAYDAMAEAERLRASKVADHARALSAKADRLREWVRVNIEAAGIKELEAGTFKVKLAKVAPSANVDLIPFMTWAVEQGRDDLITTKPAPDPAPNKREILAALKAGETLKGCELITGRTRLAVR